MQTNHNEDNRARKEGSILPKREDVAASALRKVAPPADVADRDPGGKRCQDAGRFDTLCDEKGTVGCDCRQCDFHEMIVGATRKEQQAPCKPSADNEATQHLPH